MKTFTQLTLVFLLATALGSCKKVADISKTPTTAAFTTGSWNISYLSDNSGNRAMTFNSYVLSFYSNGTASANKTGSITNGTWQLDDFDSSNKVHFDFGSADPLKQINKDWTVISIEPSKIILEDVSTSVELHLSKI